MRIGIFGGTFNPIHSGHAMIINYMSQSSFFEQIIVMVASQNPLKTGVDKPTDLQRLEMVEMVTSKFSNVIVSDLEMKMKKPSYTIDTLNELKKLKPEDSFSLIIGSDNWKNFKNWKSPLQIIENYGVVIYQRPGYLIEDILPENVFMANDCPLTDLSSTHIREIAAKKGNINFLVPLEVAEYIKCNHLYEQ